MNKIVFDSSTIISLSINNLLWVLRDLKKMHPVEFCITDSVKKEIVDNPLKTKKYKLKAIQVLSLINEGVFQVCGNGKLTKRTNYLLDIANSIYLRGNEPIKIIHTGEMEAVVLAQKLNASLVMIDERTTRLLIEKPEKLDNLLKKKLHIDIKINKEMLKTFKKEVKMIKIARSTELVIYALSQNILKKYLKSANGIDLATLKKELITGLIWGLRLNGCSITDSEIVYLIKNYGS